MEQHRGEAQIIKVLFLKLTLILMIRNIKQLLTLADQPVITGDITLTPVYYTMIINFMGLLILEELLILG